MIRSALISHEIARISKSDIYIGRNWETHTDANDVVLKLSRVQKWDPGMSQIRLNGEVDHEYHIN